MHKASVLLHVSRWQHRPRFISKFTHKWAKHCVMRPKKIKKSVLTSHRGYYSDFAQSTSPPCLFITIIIITINLVLIKALWFITLIHLHSTQWVFSFLFFPTEPIWPQLFQSFDSTVRNSPWHWTLDFYRNLSLSLRLLAGLIGLWETFPPHSQAGSGCSCGRF